MLMLFLPLISLIHAQACQQSTPRMCCTRYVSAQATLHVEQARACWQGRRSALTPRTENGRQQGRTEAQIYEVQTLLVGRAGLPEQEVLRLDIAVHVPARSAGGWSRCPTSAAPRCTLQEAGQRARRAGPRTP